MKCRILDFSVLKEEITPNNVLKMSELIAFSDVRFQMNGQYQKKAKKITVNIACIKKVMKLINRKTSDYNRSPSVEVLTPHDESFSEIPKEIKQDYILYDKIIDKPEFNGRNARRARMPHIQFEPIPIRAIPKYEEFLQNRNPRYSNTLLKCAGDIPLFTASLLYRSAANGRIVLAR
jgi:hypothetical protein